MIDFKKLRGLITDKKCIASDDYGKDDPFVGIYWGDLVDAINQCDSIRWISVDEALPEFYRNVLVIFGNLHIANAYYDGEYWWWNDGFPTGVNSYGNAIYSSQQRCEDKPTHWMYIPEIKGGDK